MSIPLQHVQHQFLLLLPRLIPPVQQQLLRKLSHRLLLLPQQYLQPMRTHLLALLLGLGVPKMCGRLLRECFLHVRAALLAGVLWGI